MKKRYFALLLLVLLPVFCACSAEEPAAPAAETAEFADLTGTPSDYAQADNWMQLPTDSTHAVDVLYFYPTAYVNVDGARICEVTDEGMRAQAQQIYARQGSVFEGLANIYVPYYRQLNGAWFGQMTNEEILAAGSEEPRTDLYAALDYYFENYNEGRPFILAGHSQGSNMLNLMLDEYFEQHSEYYARMIVAYQIGCALTRDFLEANPHVQAAQAADDLGVVVSWNTEGPGNKDAESLVVADGAVAINPLNWRTDETIAPVSENLGSLITAADGSVSLGAGIADAQLDTARGVVVCTSVDPAVYANAQTATFGPQSYHGSDYAFYYANIRANAQQRIDAWVRLSEKG